MPRSTRSTSSNGSTRSSPTRDSTTSGSAASRVTRSRSARAAPVTTPSLPPLPEDRRHSDTFLSPHSRSSPLELVPILPTPTMSSAQPSPASLPPSSITPRTPSTAESALRRLSPPADPQLTPPSEPGPRVVLSDPDHFSPSSSQFSTPPLSDRSASQRPTPPRSARSASPTFARSSHSSPTSVAPPTVSALSADPVSRVPGPTMPPPPTVAGPPPRPPALEPSSQPSDSSSSTTTLKTVCSDTTRVLLPPSAFHPAPSTAVVDTPISLSSHKVLFLNTPMTESYAFASAVRRYGEDSHIRNILPLRDKSGFMLVCDNPRSALRILRAPIPPILRGSHVRPPRPRNVTPDVTQELILHYVPLTLSLDSVQTYIQSHYGVTITYRNRLHRRDASGSLDFSSPTSQVRLRLSPADAVILQAQSEIQYQPAMRCSYLFTRSVQAVKQCFRCYQFDHISSQCPSQPVCSRCGSHGHVASDCRLSHPDCLHCHQAHYPTYRGCPVYRTINSEKQTYAQAARRAPLSALPQPPVRPLMSLSFPDHRSPDLFSFTSPVRARAPPSRDLLPDVTVPPPPILGNLPIPLVAPPPPAFADPPVSQGPAPPGPPPPGFPPMFSSATSFPPTAPFATSRDPVSAAWDLLSHLIHRFGPISLYCQIAQLLLQALPHHA